MTKTHTYRGHEIFVGVSPSIRVEGGVYYCTLWRSNNGEMHQIHHPELPDRKTKAAAQKDLNQFADKRKQNKEPSHE